ncbi:uromodulin-like isoform 2-T2 [Discoglossus pictus]
MKFLFIFVLTALLKHADGSNYTNCESCGGECAPGNGCSCTTSDSICIPTTCAMDSNECCPPGLFWLNTCCSENVTCDKPCAMDEECAAVEGKAVCVCNSAMYLKRNISDLVPSVNCSSDVMTASLSRCLLYSLGYDYFSFHLNIQSEGCNFSYFDVIHNKSVRSIQTKTLAGWCGNIADKDSSKVYFTNTLHIGIQNKTLITVNPIEVNFTCSYNLTMQTALNVTLHPKLSTTYITAPNGEGLYKLIMAAYSNPEFTQPIQTDENVKVGSSVYLALFVSDADGDKFALGIVQCFATSINDRNDAKKVQLVSKGCAVDDGVDTEVFANKNSLEARFKISAFLFDTSAAVYIFCDVQLCNKSENCDVCDSSRASQSGAQEVMLPLSFDDDLLLSSSVSRTALSWAVLAGSFLMLLSNTLF